MKTILLLITLFPLLINAQESKRYKFKSYSFQTIYLDKHGDYIYSSTAKDSSIIIVINTTDKNIKFYRKPLKIFDLTNEGTKYDDEDIFNYIRWSALDDYAKQCNIRLLKVKDKLISDEEERNDYTLFIDYKNTIYTFSMKLSD